MDINSIIAIAGIVGSAIVGLFGLWKLISDLQLGRQGQMREEYKFAQGFFADLKSEPTMLPFLKQKGLQAIAGDTRLASEEIEYLLALHNPAESLRNFVLGRKYLEFLVTVTDAQVAFRQKYQRKSARNLTKLFYLGIYVICYCCASSPLYLLLFEMISLGKALFIFALLAPVLLPACFFAIRAGIRVSKAEKMVANQHKHSKQLVLAAKRA